ncbi:MAG: ATP-binding protein [Verrucomicrobiota bacterium]
MNVKTRDELIIEMQALLHENNSLKESLNRSLTLSEQAKEASAQLDGDILKLNHFAVELSMLTHSEDLKALIIRLIKEFSGATFAMFSDYDPISRTLITKHTEMEPGLLQKFVSMVGKKGRPIRSEVNDEMFQYITREVVEVRKTLYDVSFGNIPRPLAKAIQTLLKVDRFIGIAYLVKGELYGTSLLGMPRDKPDPQMQILKNFISLASVSLRRKQAEDKIREKDIEFRKLSSHVPDLIFQFTRKPDGTYFVPIASEGIRNIFGCSPEDVLDDFGPIARVIYPEDAERVIHDIEYSAEHLTYFTCEFRVQIPGRKIQWIYSNSSPERLSDGSVTWYGFNVDITDRKQIELELQKAKEMAEESEKLKTALLNNMSHEIRTPMNAIIGFSSLLADANEEERVFYVDIIQKGSDHLLKLMDDVILLSRLQSEKMPINIDNCRPGDIVSYVYHIFNTKDLKEGIILKTVITPQFQDVVIQADENRIRQVLANLVSNAIKFTPQGEIEIGYLFQEETIEFYVKDSGIGIPLTEQTKIFDTFYRGEEARSMAIRGNGLGLNISKELVELMRGTISVDSVHKKGTRFYFSIPLIISKPLELVSQITRGSDKCISDFTVLVAEDELINFTFLKIILKNKVKSIDHAMNGREAVEMAFSNHYDLILLYIKMPVMDGLEASVLLKRTFPELIIIAQSAYSLPEEIERAFEAGCDDFISKPINKEILLETIIKYGKMN